MKEITIEAKTVEEAIEKGLEEMGGPSRESVEIEVLDEGKSGLFGLGGKEARVRLTLKEGTSDQTAPAAEKPEEILTESKTAGEEKDPGREAPEISGDPEKLALETVREILKRMEIDADVQVSREEDEILISIDGAGGKLIGRRGQTLFSLQYLINRIVGRETGSDEMIIIDVEGYRKRREKEMTEMAERLYRQVQESGRSVTVKNLSAHDRRIIHLSLKSRQAVETYSRGNGHLRRLVIAPKGQGRKSENDRRRSSRPQRQRSGQGESSSSSGANNRIQVFTKRFTDSSSGSYSDEE